MSVASGRQITVEELLARAREAIGRFSPTEAVEAVGRGAILVDIRQAHQRDREGLLPGAVVIERNVLEWRLDPRSEHRDPRLARAGAQVILICAEGYQSSLAAATLGSFGLAAGDVVGGSQAWKRDGLPLRVGTGSS